MGLTLAPAARKNVGLHFMTFFSGCHALTRHTNASKITQRRSNAFAEKEDMIYLPLVKKIDQKILWTKTNCKKCDEMAAKTVWNTNNDSNFDWKIKWNVGVTGNRICQSRMSLVWAEILQKIGPYIWRMSVCFRDLYIRSPCVCMYR